MMADISLTGVLVVAAIAFTVPLVLGLAPTLHFPSVVLEIVAGIVIGPARAASNPLQADGRWQELSSGRAFAGDLATIHRRRHGDRDGA
jgi:Kef-type K+ transport system membrane component KefB